MAMAMEVSMQNDTASMNNEVIEIDLLQLISDIWKAIRSYGWLLLALISILGTIGFFIARSVYTPYYEAYTTFTVNTVSSVNFNSRNQKNTVTNKIGQIFPYILTSDALRSLVIEDMGYEDGETFPAEIKASVVKDTNLVTLAVQSEDPQIAYDVLRAVLRNYPSISEVAIGDVALKQMDESGFPSEPANAPGARRAAAVGMLLGLLAFVAYFAIRSVTKTTVRSEEELTRTFNTEYLGNLPSVVFKKRSRKQDAIIAIDAEGIPFSFVEAVRTIRHRVEREAQKSGAKTIIVTSTLQAEGKTTTAANLAIALANHKHNVLLIDGDLRNPSIIPALGLGETQYGMGDLLSGKCNLDDVLVRYKDRKHLTLIPGGKPVANPVPLWGSHAAEQLIKELRNRYDYIIIDAPPSAIVSDASLIARYTDGCVYVVRQDYASINSLREGMEMFSGTGCRLLGCVLNHAEAGGTGYGYGRYGYGRYGYGKYGYGKSGYGYGYGYGYGSTEKSAAETIEE